MQTLTPGTSGELYQATVLLDPHSPHVVPVAVKIFACCRKTGNANGAL